MKWIMFGLVGFVGVGLVGLQGVAVHKNEENYGKGVVTTVEFYQSNPGQTRRWVEAAIETCLTQRGEGLMSGVP